MEFWSRHPALFVALFSLLGAASALVWHPLFVLFLLLFSLSYILDGQQRRIRLVWQKLHAPVFICAIGLGSLTFFSTLWRLPATQLPEERVEGEGVFHIENVKIVQSPFQRSYCYKGILKEFHAKNGHFFFDLPCLIFHPLKNPPRADRDYRLSGTLCQKGRYDFCLKPHKGKKWQDIPGTFSFAGWRCQAKQCVAASIKKQIPSIETATFLTALITGETEERSLRIDFSRLGLQHLLAISGFHFSFFALALHFLLRLFCPFKTRILLVLFALALYFFFLGNAPSILRAFLAISLYFIAQLLRRRTNGLNVLGAALCVELLVDPLVPLQLSFQLSFLCTLALLLYTPLLHTFFMRLLPRRTPKELQQMSLLDQHGYLGTTLLRKALSVTCAVHLFSLPLLLYLFHKFPLLSVLYNLFFPFCVTLSLALLYLGFLLAWLPPVCALVHKLNAFWTSQLLELTSHPPAYFDIVLHTPAFPYPLLLILLFLLFAGGIVAQNSVKTNKIFAL